MSEKDLSVAEPLIANHRNNIKVVDDTSPRLWGEFGKQDNEAQKLLNQLKWLRLLFVLAYLPAIVLYVLSVMQWSRRPYVYPEMMPSPIQKSNSLQWEVMRFPSDFHDSVFAGDPRPELDLHGTTCLKSGIDNNVRVEKEDLDVLGLKSVELVDGGYVAQLGVFHELHCLKKIRHWVFKETYVLPKNLSRAELEEWPAHINHCIEMLRLSIMCKADTSLSTYAWIGPEENRVPSAWDRSPHQCVVWDSLVEWTRERSVNISAPKAIFNERGEPFP